MNALVLLSGGIDSSCCVVFYRQMRYIVKGVFVDYGQPVNQKEEQSAKAIAEHYGIPLDVIRCSGPTSEFRDEIAGRNAFLIFSTLLHHRTFAGMLAIGIHSGTGYYDCSEHFTNQLSSILTGYTDGRIALATPFLSWPKQRIYDLCAKYEVPIQLTWSCEVGPVEPCGHCLSCKDREYLDVCTSK
jgi:7-cyano-7-deazaguanine synthase